MPKLQAPPEGGITVRMYRQGHGDCFLLALSRPKSEEGDEREPFYVLIDCGYKPGSPAFVHGKSIGDIVNRIGKSTSNRLDLMIITHEHQDHVNGIWKKKKPYFDRFEIGEAWLAWTEDPDDDLANELCRRHRHQLLGLAEARRALALAVKESDPVVSRRDSLLALELAGEEEDVPVETLLAAANDPRQSTNKQAMKLVKDKASRNRGVRYLRPGGKPLEIPGTGGIRAYVLGPPHDGDLLEDEHPVGQEAFPEHEIGSRGLSFFAAAKAPAGERLSPFADSFSVGRTAALAEDDSFFVRRYGQPDGGGRRTPAGNAAYRFTSRCQLSE